jgi:predicted heme/steroid binding protein
VSIYTVEEIAAQMGKSGRWVRYLCSHGKLKAVKKGHSWVILEAWK